MDGSDHSLSVDIEMTATLMFAQLFLAYIESDPAVRQIVRDMVGIVNDPDVELNDHGMAIETIREALFRTGRRKEVARPEERSLVVLLELAVSPEFDRLLDELAVVIQGSKADAIQKGVEVLKRVSDAKQAGKRVVVVDDANQTEDALDA